MQLPTVERSPPPRPAGAADVVVPAAARVIPVAPINPEVPLTASVVNEINPEVQARAVQAATEAVQAGREDPLLQGGSRTDDSAKDWTQRKPAPEKIEEPPKEPIAKMLIEHIHAMWSASARVVEIWLMNNPGQNQMQSQVQNLAETRNQNPAAIPGVLAKEVLTYSPSKIKKTEKPE